MTTLHDALQRAAAAQEAITTTIEAQGTVVGTHRATSQAKKRMGAPPRGMPEQFGPMLKQLREGAGWSQSELGRRTGSDHSLISRYESGERGPFRESLDALCRALELDDAGRIRLFAAAEIWPFEDVPTPSEADMLDTVMATRQLPEDVLDDLRSAVRMALRQARRAA